MIGTGRPGSPELEACLEGAGLDGERARAFARARRRIEEHHGQWRRGFPAYASLLDEEAQRAQALAGSYAAEGRDTLHAWVDAHLDQAQGHVDPERLPELQGWLRRYADAWKAAVREDVELRPWEGAARERFHEVLDDVVESGRAAAAARLEEAAAPRPAAWWRFLEPLWRPLAAVGRVVRSVFWPAGG